LAAYVDRVMTHGLTRYPEQLENLEMLEEGRSLREKVARNALRVQAEQASGQGLANFEAMRAALEAAVRKIAEQP
jgi:hypothetical protein